MLSTMFPKALPGAGRQDRWLASLDQTERRLAASPRADLKSTIHSLAFQARCGEPLTRLVPETFACVRLAAEACLGLRHRANQLRTGASLLQRCVVELPTGEGKTLSATLALAVRALAGKGAWLATANDYLARRDAETMRPVFEQLGLTVGCVQAQQPTHERRAAYRCDITYGTLREFGFDFLRDRRGSRGDDGQFLPVQRELHSLILDEADSLLLDEARTPLIISEIDPEETTRIQASFPWAAAVSREMVENLHWLVDPATRQVYLTEEGRQFVRERASSRDIRAMSLRELYDAAALAVRVRRDFLENRDFVIRDGRIVIVDAFTGRLSEGRRWQSGIHEMLEAGAELEVQPQTHTAARITVQTFLQHFRHLSGMTGTCREATRELRRIYGLKTTLISPTVPSQRQQQPAQVFDTRAEKWQAIVAVVRQRHAAGQPVLVGTRDIRDSDTLSQLFLAAGLPHAVLHAREEDREAAIVARAGEHQAITIATNMAGRGTDIALGSGVHERGGLHVIAADLFDSSRIDRQLAGRCSRQGDPGSYQQILSLEDAILVAAYGHRAHRYQQQGQRSSQTGRLRLLQAAQRQLERRHWRERARLQSRETELHERYQRLGYDPFLDDPLDG